MSASKEAVENPAEVRASRPEVLGGGANGREPRKVIRRLVEAQVFLRNVPHRKREGQLRTQSTSIAPWGWTAKRN